MDPVEKTIESYDSIAEEYCEKTMKGGNRDFQEDMIDKTLKMLPNHPRIIDPGCGDGRDTAYMREKGADVVGIDLSQEMIDLAKRKQKKGTYLQMDMRDTIFPEDTFHGAWASASIFNLPKSELSKVESEIYRIVEPGGLFAFSFKKGEGEGMEENGVMDNGYPRYVSYYTVDELRERFRLFDIVQSRECPDEIFGSRFVYCWAESRDDR